MVAVIKTWVIFFFFFKQKTAYEIVSRDWSSDVCSSDLFYMNCTAHISRNSCKIEPLVLDRHCYRTVTELPAHLPYMILITD